MPYIKAENRKQYDKVLKHLIEIETKGDLEYCVFKLMKTFMSTREKRYSTLHEVVYAVIHAGEEFKRRYLDVRENEAREENGDV